MFCFQGDIEKRNQSDLGLPKSEYDKPAGNYMFKVRIEIEKLEQCVKYFQS